MKIVSPFVGLIATLSLLVVSATASASSEKEMTTKSVFTT